MEDNLLAMLRSRVFASRQQDLNGDGLIDIADLRRMSEAFNTPASGSDDPRDLNGDGWINVLDVRGLVLLCDYPRCQTGPAPAGEGYQTHLYYVHTDHLGTVQVITASDARPVWRAGYRPFGEVELAEGLIEFNFRFPGQYFDAETGTHYSYFRDYDPSTGRYIQSDPIGLGGGLNTYSYVQNNPADNADYLGLATYICTRPLGGNPGSWAPPVINHTYTCVGDHSTRMTCGSTTASAPGILPSVVGGSPGIPTTPTQDYYDPDACERRWDEDRCIETCIADELNRSSRPWYGVGPAGTDCQEYTWEVVHMCERLCGRR